MRILGRNKIQSFVKKHTDAKRALEAWYQEALSADWKTPQDIRNRYRTADFISGNRVIFNIKGNHYRLVVMIRYENGIAVILWVGTHAEYDKQTF